jgi:aspartyl-tRNA synthetase
MGTFLSEHKRTHHCGELRKAHIGQRVVLCGWVDGRRDHGGCVFVDLRDKEGLTQVVFDPKVDENAHALAGDLRSEFCIGVVGKVISRGDKLNDRMPTGEIEVQVEHLEVFSRSDTPPFPVTGDVETKEALRLKYRYLDLRRPELQKNLIIRSKAAESTRRYLADHGFTEVETPFMVKYTPGGARNFLVPSRLNPGCFYALAESPQIFKQLLMVAGYERYYQIVRCFRDEALRQDRQQEFTQIDIEMSFIEEADLQRVIEGMIQRIWSDVLGEDLKVPFRRMTYAEAMEKYGVDKPDLRLDLVLADVTQAATGSGFRVFDQVIEKGGIVKCLRVPDGAGAERLSRSQLDGLTEFAKPFGVKGVGFARIEAGGVWKAPFAKAFSETARNAVNQKAQAQDGDVLIFVAEKPKVANTCLGAIRLHIGELLKLTRENEWQFMWLVDPPLFEHDEESGKYVSAHHPFTSPKAGHENLLDTPEKVLARAYDLVLNGIELGGGSIRIHRADLQEKVFHALGIAPDDAKQKFGFLLDAFRYGPPPHGGIAFGLDRLAMLLSKAQSLRDVIAFPKTQKGTDLMSDAPTPVDNKQLEELFVQVSPNLPKDRG